MDKCTKCGGFVIEETYRSEEGKCSYMRCVMCGTCIFIEKAEPGGRGWASSQPSFSEIGKAMGITKQRAGYLYLRALKKIAKLHPGIWRLR